jgi:hypothetical protein
MLCAVIGSIAEAFDTCKIKYHTSYYGMSCYCKELFSIVLMLLYH